MNEKVQSESEKATNKEKLEARNSKLDARNPKLEAGNPKLFKFSPSAKQKLVFVRISVNPAGEISTSRGLSVGSL